MKIKPNHSNYIGN